MIVDLYDLESSTELHGDVCIVGSGAAGLAIAMELLNSPLRVLLLEGGGDEYEAETQELYDVNLEGLPYTGARDGRVRVFGGSTTRWGGQALPLTALDFERRDWVPNSGWPITLEDLNPFYHRAARFLRIDDWNFDTDIFRRFGITPPSFDRAQLKYHVSKWCPRPDLGAVYRQSLARAENIQLLLHANVTELLLNNAGRAVREVVARSLRGHVLRVRARWVILCCGGLETARVLLASNRQYPDGIGNGHGLVGCFLQDHPGAVLGTIRPRNPNELQRLFNLYHAGGVRYSIRCSAAPELQRECRTLNASASVMFVAEEDSPIMALKAAYHSLKARRFDAAVARSFVAASRHPVEIARPLFEYFARNRIYTPRARFRLGISTEQEPDAGSRVLLTAQRDVLEMPKLSVQWKLTDASWHVVTTFLNSLQRQFDAAGVGTIDLDTWLMAENVDWRSRLVDHYHHMGTTRMHESPTRGVVDAHCRVHGVSNLYVSSSAVFPTGGHSNPTMTIIALSIRIADELRTTATT